MTNEKIYSPQELKKSGRLPGMTYRQILYLIETGKLKASNIGLGRPRYLIRESAIEEMLSGEGQPA